MASLTELVDRVNKSAPVEPLQLEIYQKSTNDAERFLSHRAAATLKLREGRRHLRQCLEAIDFADQRMVEEYLQICEVLGDLDERTEPLARFGAAAIARGEFSLGIEAIQTAVSMELQRGAGSFLSKKENCLWLASQYERAAQEIGWWTPEGMDWGHDVLRLGWIITEIADESAAARMLAGLADVLNPKRCELFVYSTNAAAQGGAITLRTLQESGAKVWLGPRNGNALSTAGALAESMVLDEIDAAIFDVTQADAAAALVASWPVARAKINWSLTSPLYSAEMNAVIYSDAKRHDAEKDFWAERRIESRFIFEGTVPEKIREGVAARRAWGIPESAVVLATAGTNLEQTLGDEFVETVIEALKTNRQAICLIIGPGNFSAQKKRFAGAGVSGRVGYVAGTAEVLAICDIYLADSPDAQTEGMLQAMELGKPILVGKLGAQYSARLAKLMREPEQRRILGKTMRRQISEQFSIRRTAELIIELCNSLLGGDQKAPAPPVSETAPALAKVA